MPRSIRQHARSSFIGLITVLSLVASSHAATTFDVAAGWDLLKTTSGSFPGLGNLVGVPLATFDFDNFLARNIGVQNTPTTDTIIERRNSAVPALPVAGQAATTPVEMQVFQVQTVSPVDFAGNGVDNYFITLQSVRGGPASTGTQTIAFDASGLGGTSDAAIDVFFDIRKGSLSGPIVLSSDLVLVNSGAAWTDLPTAGALQITNANRFLSGVANDRSQDFWFTAPVTSAFPNGAQFTQSSATPEPTSAVLLAVALVSGITLRHRRP